MALATLSAHKNPLLFLVIAALLSAAPRAAALAEVHSSNEYEIKAAFIYNFAKFVEWPEPSADEGSGVFLIGLLGKDPFGPELDKLLEGKTVHNRKLEIRRLQKPEEAKNCQLLFIGESESGRLEKDLEALDSLPILTVGDMDRFILRGGMVGLTIEDQKIRFVINQGPAGAAGLKISSQLLKLAKVVIGFPTPKAE